MGEREREGYKSCGFGRRLGHEERAQIGGRAHRIVSYRFDSQRNVLHCMAEPENSTTAGAHARRSAPPRAHDRLVADSPNPSLHKLLVLVEILHELLHLVPQVGDSAERPGHHRHSRRHRPSCDSLDPGQRSSRTCSTLSSPSRRVLVLVCCLRFGERSAPLHRCRHLASCNVVKSPRRCSAPPHD